MRFVAESQLLGDDVPMMSQFPLMSGNYSSRGVAIQLINTDILTSAANGLLCGLDFLGVVPKNIEGEGFLRVVGWRLIDSNSIYL